MKEPSSKVDFDSYLDDDITPAQKVRNTDGLNFQAVHDNFVSYQEYKTELRRFSKNVNEKVKRLSQSTK